MKYLINLLVILMTLTQAVHAASKPKVVVVGAGLAGLTAAYRLQQADMDVEIYESKPRVGGRVFSVLIENFDGEYPVFELGGHNITDGGEAKNIINLAKELKLEIIEESVKFNRLYHNGKQFQDYHQIISKVGFTTEELEKKFDELQDKNNMREVLDALFPSQSDLNRIFTFFLNAYEGDIPEKLSVHHNIDTLKYMILGGIAPAHQVTGDAPEVKFMHIKNGNANLPLKLASLLGDRLYLNKTLIAVTHDDDKISLTFKDGSVVSCDKLVLAIPTPVYKNIDFKNKVIDKKRLEAIKQIAYGQTAKMTIPAKYKKSDYSSYVTDKIIFFFNKDSTLFSMYFINDTGEKGFLQQTYLKEFAKFKTYFSNMKLSSSQIAEPQEEQFAKYDMPIAKSWVRDPDILGSYSYYNNALGKKIDDMMWYRGIYMKKIFAPVKEQIFFAGEHATILQEIGTMEAAVESGERIAKLIKIILK